MADHILSKGFLATGSTAFAMGEAVIVTTANRTAARSTTASAEGLVGIAIESVDAAKVTTGNVVVGVALIGAARCLAGAAVAVGASVTNDTTARLVSLTKATAGTVPKKQIGIAMSAAGAAGDYFDVLLTPGAEF